ncbi:Alpha/Beta hydrolase protein [Jimgerdemannia flammicorona]|uniref:Alpha/Beta hydrolase protein n=1 Tax=Jimgerdemannia flammicorona TaxID=994334 RepID=A0A433D9E0_9FUNG|nr:Alpha/Beta hydrolase protein [Jimgerdemannia flammicorona]
MGSEPQGRFDFGGKYSSRRFEIRGCPEYAGVRSEVSLDAILAVKDCWTHRIEWKIRQVLYNRNQGGPESHQGHKPTSTAPADDDFRVLLGFHIRDPDDFRALLGFHILRGPRPSAEPFPDKHMCETMTQFIGLAGHGKVRPLHHVGTAKHAPPPPPPPPATMSLLSILIQRTVLVSASLVVGYALVVLLLTFPVPQRHAIYLNWANYPFKVDWDAPECFGFAHNKVRNFNITTSDNVTLGAWHVLPSKYHMTSGLRHVPANATVPESKYEAAFTQKGVDTVLYLHGNAGNRASPWRIGTYKRLADKFNINIVTVDYRGFGNSGGFPTEEGLKIDAKAVWDWLISRGVRPNQIIVFGHSLGTGVATHLASSLSLAGTPPKTLILEAAYSSIAELLFDYRMLSVVPLLGPFKWFPYLQDRIRERLNEQFDSLAAIEHVTSPTLLIYGTRDSDIPPSHSRRLFHRSVYRRGDNTSAIPLFEAEGVWPRGDGGFTARIVPGEGARFDYIPAKGVKRAKMTLVELDWAHHNNCRYSWVVSNRVEWVIVNGSMIVVYSTWVYPTSTSRMTFLASLPDSGPKSDPSEVWDDARERELVWLRGGTTDS